jgi:hypothetical protein
LGDWGNRASAASVLDCFLAGELFGTVGEAWRLAAFTALTFT